MSESAPVRDQWAQWLLTHRFAGADYEQKQYILSELSRVRDAVLEHAEVHEGDVLLDVGAGDGLIAFGALSLLGESGRVLFSDISQDLLDHSRVLAEQMDVADRMEFFRASADDHSAIPKSTVDIVTTRSVLVFVADKSRAFAEFHRVLKAGGRLSVFEPINRFGLSEKRADRFFGCDVAPVQAIAAKLQALYERRQLADQPLEHDPMLNFDERDLFQYAEDAGFDEIHLEYRAWTCPRRPMNWQFILKTAGNPKIPSLEQAMDEVLTEAETQAFTAYFRPLVEAGGGTQREAVAYLWATKR